MLDLTNFDVILASKSPRRQSLLKQLLIPFTITTKAIDESYPTSLQANQISEYIANKKSESFGNLQSKQLLITSDTIVWLENKCLEKPQSKEQAIDMLMQLSGKTHQVFTSVALRTNHHKELFTETTQVTFRELSLAEIQFYVSQFPPLDKAGAYGIQDWIGCVGVQKITGCYYNVMGLPLAKLYQYLKKF